MKSLFKKIIHKDAEGPGSGSPGSLSRQRSMSPNGSPRLMRRFGSDIADPSSPSSQLASVLRPSARGVWNVRSGLDKEGDRRAVLVFVPKPAAAAAAAQPPQTPTQPNDAAAHYDLLRTAVRSSMLPPAALREPAVLCAEAHNRHRSLRHPGVLPYVSGYSTGHDSLLVTEPAVPLRTHLATNAVSLDALCLGVSTVAKTLMWLHENCRIAYNNVSVDGIFVATHGPSAGRWLLGDFAFACAREHEDLVQHSMAHQTVVAPEDFLPSGREADLASRDVYALGCLIDEIVTSGGPGTNSAAALRRDVLGSLLQDLSPDDLTHRSVSVANASTLSVGGLEGKLAGRGLSAILGEVSAAIEWVDIEAVPAVPVVSAATDVRPLELGEEVAIWALGAMHVDPGARPTLESLVEGRFLNGSLLVRAHGFLAEERLLASDEEKSAGYSLVLEAFERCLYSDVLDHIAPLLCNRSAFLDPAGDAVYEQFLVPCRGEPLPTTHHNLPPPASSNTGVSSDSIGHVDSGAPSNKDSSAEAPALQGFAAGVCIEATGLKKAPELNGLRGRVIGLDEDVTRVLVAFDAPGHEPRALRPENLLRIATRTAGVLTPVDYQRIAVPFLRKALQNRVDTGLRVALLRRAKHFVGTFDHSAVLPEVIACLRDDSPQNDTLRAAACSAVPSFAASLAASPKTLLQLVSPLHRLVHTAAAPEHVRRAAVAAVVAVWGSHGTPLAVSACSAGVADPALAAVTLEALCGVLQTDAVPPEEVVGVVVPLAAPCVLHPEAEVREGARRTLHLALACLARSKGVQAFPPPRALPSPASVVATVPRTSR